MAALFDDACAASQCRLKDFDKKKNVRLSLRVVSVSAYILSMFRLTAEERQNEPDAPAIPNSARFWRLNAIEALKIMTWRHESLACDPEEHAALVSRQAELKKLQARENAVRMRYHRLLNQRSPP